MTRFTSAILLDYRCLEEWQALRERMDKTSKTYQCGVILGLSKIDGQR